MSDNNSTVEAAPARAPVNNVSKTSSSTKGPQISFDSLEHDFGVMPETETRSGALRFTNVGDETLVITDVTTTCGCTAATPDKQRYEPGESGEIRINFDPSGPNDPGKPQRKYVKVFSNSRGAEEPTQITVIADVRAFVLIDPRSVEFDIVDLGRTKTIDVTVSCTDPDFTIERVAVTNKYLNGELLEKEVADAESAQRIIRVSVQSDAPWGNLFGWLDVTVHGRPSPEQDPITHTARMRVNAKVFGELMGDPDTFRFGVAPNETFERQVMITHREGQQFEIRRASCDCDLVSNETVTMRRVSASQVELTFRAVADSLPAGIPSRTAYGKVTIETNIDGPESKVEIPIVGVVRTSTQH